MSKVNKKFKKMRELIQAVPENKLPFAEKLMDELEFMSVTLEELKADIRENGVVVNAVGSMKQEVTKGNPSLTNYNTLVKNYNNTIKQICDLLPEGDTQAKSALQEFLSR